MSILPHVMEQIIMLFGAAALGMLIGWIMRPLFVDCFDAVLNLIKRQPKITNHAWIIVSRGAAIAVSYLFVVWVMDWPWYSLIIAFPTTVIGIAVATPLSPSE